MNDIADLLDKAADEVSKDWCQEMLGAPHSRNGAVCSIGAIRRVDYFTSVIEVALGDGGSGIRYVYGGNEPAMIRALFKYLGLSRSVHRDGTFSSAIAAWNDEPGRTAGEVADAMRGAAKMLREREGAPDAGT